MHSRRQRVRMQTACCTLARCTVQAAQGFHARLQQSRCAQGARCRQHELCVQSACARPASVAGFGDLGRQKNFMMQLNVLVLCQTPIMLPVQHAPSAASA